MCFNLHKSGHGYKRIAPTSHRDTFSYKNIAKMTLPSVNNMKLRLRNKRWKDISITDVKYFKNNRGGDSFLFCLFALSWKCYVTRGKNMVRKYGVWWGWSWSSDSQISIVLKSCENWSKKPELCHLCLG